MSEYIYKIYQDFAPRWFKVIRWKEFAQRQINNQKFLACTVWPSMLFCFYQVLDPNRTSVRIALEKPQTEEEILKIKSKWNHNQHRRNWEIDQYYYQVPPYYDLAVRRKAYPEYYGNRYDGFKRWDV